MNKKHSSIGPEEAGFRLSDTDATRLAKQSGKVEIIGQPRALQALRMGTAIQGNGYNVFITGAAGTGRRSAVDLVLSECKKRDDTCRDITYVFNFKEPDKPKVLDFQAGEASAFKKDIHQLVENLKSTVKIRLESGMYTEQRDELVGIIEREENKRLSQFESTISKEGFQIMYVEEGEGQATDIVPLYKGSPVSFDQLHSHVGSGEISEEEWNSFREKYYRYMDEMKAIFSELRRARSTLGEELEELQAETVRPAISAEVDHIREKYTEPDVLSYLDQLEEDLIENVYLFLIDRRLKDDEGNPQFIRYGVNVIKDCSLVDGTFPVVHETHPSYSNLFGNIEMKTEAGGETRTSFMMIQAGSLIKANGGFLIMNAVDLLRESVSWYHLKRALQTGKVEIQYPEGPYLRGSSLMKPEPIEINVRVLLLGTEGMYDALYTQDPDFKKHFKLHAEFAELMNRSDEAMVQYAGFIRNLIREEGLREADPSGIAACIEYGVRLAQDKTKLSTRFSRVSDCIREADYWAGEAGKPAIGRDSVRQALEAKKYLSGGIEEKIDEMIALGDMLVSVEGTEVGRVNGLAIYDRGYFAFSRPSVISARVSPGERGVVNIEREAGLSGEIHNKGILILEGFLRSTYAGTIPLSIHASICFEQSYGEIDGDSASSTEVYALLSAISGVPLRQDIAVTGSVNQMGRIQPVGGISEKVEGFFRICGKLGLSGTQGVIIPKQNVRNLVLSEDVCGAIEKGAFAVYPVESIDDGLEILTGMEAGIKGNGSFPEGSCNGFVENRLTEMAEQVRRFHHP